MITRYLLVVRCEGSELPLGVLQLSLDAVQPRLVLALDVIILGML